MNTVLWIIAIVLAVAFVAAGTLKLARSKEQLLEMGMGWTEDFSGPAIKGIATLELVGAAGLILPAALGAAEVLTPLAATGLALVMAGAVVVHIRRGERQESVPPLVLGLVSVFVAFGRFGPWSF